jgi:hypothetical protein
MSKTYCTNCGAAIESGAFCVDCGAPAANAGEAPAAKSLPSQSPASLAYQQLNVANDQKPEYSGMAIASLVSSLLGISVLFFIGSVVGVVFGHRALSEIRALNTKGRGLAIAGLIIGYIPIAGVVVLVISFIGYYAR